MDVFRRLVRHHLSSVDKGKTATLTQMPQGLYEVSMKLIDIAMRIAPFGVAGLVFSTTATLDLADVAIPAKYMVTVLAALAMHQFLTYGVVVR